MEAAFKSSPPQETSEGVLFWEHVLKGGSRQSGQSGARKAQRQTGAGCVGGRRNSECLSVSGLEKEGYWKEPSSWVEQPSTVGGTESGKRPPRPLLLGPGISSWRKKQRRCGVSQGTKGSVLPPGPAWKAVSQQRKQGPSTSFLLCNSSCSSPPRSRPGNQAKIPLA